MCLQRGHPGNFTNDRVRRTLRDGAVGSVGTEQIALTVKGEEMETGTFKIDPEKKVKTIDLDIQSGNDKGKKQLGIYAVKGDMVTFCFAPPGETERPTKLESKEDDSTIFVVMKREKK